MTRSFFTALLVATALAACATPSAPPAPAIDAAGVLAAPSRLAGDADNDARRKAAETLAFMQVAPGMALMDVEAGGGYYTELLAIAVGPQGSVVMQYPAPFANFYREALGKRFAGGRLANVRQSPTLFDALDAPDGSLDLVTWVQGPHELFFEPPGAGSLGDAAKAYAEVFRVLKPGGAFVVVDHSAIAGSPESVGGTLHRIDPAHVIARAQAAGFRLDARGDFLANPADPRTANVFDASIRGHTDQFALRFRKAR
jgi:predicted methyltransferase